MSVAQAPREFKELPLSLIDEPALPSRSAMSDERMDALVSSIRAIGLQQPMIVARVGERFEVIAGHRRRIACGRAGLVTAPCIVYPSKDVDLTVVQAHENSRREDLNPCEEALWFAELLEGPCGGDIEKLCAMVGEKLSYVDGRLALLRGDPEIFQALERGQIRIGVAHELNKCPDEKYRRYYLKLAIQSGATVALVVGWITEWKNLFGAPQPDAPAVEPSVAAMPTEQKNPFTCEVCGKSDHVHLILHVPVHQHCKLAILDPLLKTYHGVE